jgi:hypothetical protein
MRGGLLRFIASICQDLGVVLKENVYATNAAKNCFLERPTVIRKEHGVDVLELSAPLWLPVLRAELEQFPDALVISLGEPVLSMLVKDRRGREMKDYWGYDKRWKAGARHPMHPIEAEDSTVGRHIYPFVHQPSLRGGRTEFYRVSGRSTCDLSWSGMGLSKQLEGVPWPISTTTCSTTTTALIVRNMNASGS